MCTTQSARNAAESFKFMPEDDEQNIPAASPSEPFGSIRNDAETFGTVPNDAEGFRTIPQVAERTEAHTLTVREVARFFEQAGVARTERSIVNWCQTNAQGIARLDAYYDPNERRYYITRVSVDRAIEEEKARGERTPIGAEDNDTSKPDPPKVSEDNGSSAERDSERERQIRELELKVRDLEITNRAKDHFIEQLQEDRNGLLNDVKSSSHRIGVLETELKLLEPAPDSVARERSETERLERI